MKKFITVENGRVQLIHNMPFDSVYGLGKSEAELMAMGVLLDEVPEPEQIAGKIATAMYNEAQGFHYVYNDTPARENDNGNGGSNGDTLKQAVASGVISPEQYQQLTNEVYRA